MTRSATELMLFELVGRVLIAFKSVVSLAVMAMTAFAEAMTLAVVDTSKLSPKKGDAVMPWKKDKFRLY